MQLPVFARCWMLLRYRIIALGRHCLAWAVGFPAEPYPCWAETPWSKLLHPTKTELWLQISLCKVKGYTGQQVGKVSVIPVPEWVSEKLLYFTRRNQGRMLNVSDSVPWAMSEAQPGTKPGLPKSQCYVHLSSRVTGDKSTLNFSVLTHAQDFHFPPHLLPVLPSVTSPRGLETCS